MDGSKDSRGHHNIAGIGKWYRAHRVVGNQLSLRPRQPDREAFKQKSFEKKNVWARGNCSLRAAVKFSDVVGKCVKFVINCIVGFSCLHQRCMVPDTFESNKTLFPYSGSQGFHTTEKQIIY